MKNYEILGKKHNENNAYGDDLLKTKKCIIWLFIIIFIIFAILFSRSNKLIFEDKYKIYNRNYFLEYSTDGKVGVVDKTGKEIIHTIYSEIYIPNPEKDVFICNVDENNYEIINSKGEKLFEGFNNISALITSEENLELEKEVLKYEENGKYGLIDLDGNIIVQATYDSIESLKSKPGKLLVEKDENFGVLDSKGNEIIPTEYASIVGDNYSTQEDGYTKTGYIVKKKTDEGLLSGYISSSGKLLLKPEYELVERIFNYNDKENIYLIEMKAGKKGVYKNKKQIIENFYQSILFSSSSNIIVAKTTKNNTFYNLDGKQILDDKYEEYSLAGKYILVKKNDTKKLYDTNGNFITNPSYKSIENTSNSNYFITIDDNNYYSIMNKSTVIKDNYINLKYAYDDYFIFTTQENKVGVLNVWSGVVVPAEYDSILKIYNIDCLEAKRGNETDIYSKDMKKISTISDAIVENIKDKYAVVYSNDNIIYLSFDGKQISNTEIFDNKLYAVKQNDKWGFQDKKGNIIVECNYDIVTELNTYGFAGIKKDGKWGVIDEEGNIIVEPKYELDTYYFPSFLGKTYIEETENIHCIKLED